MATFDREHIHRLARLLESDNEWLEHYPAEHLFEADDRDVRSRLSQLRLDSTPLVEDILTLVREANPASSMDELLAVIDDDVDAELERLWALDDEDAKRELCDLGVEAESLIELVASQVEMVQSRNNAYQSLRLGGLLTTALCVLILSTTTHELLNMLDFEARQTTPTPLQVSLPKGSNKEGESLAATPSKPDESGSPNGSERKVRAVGFAPGGSTIVPESHRPETATSLKVRVKSGDSLYSILKKRGLPASAIPALLSVGKDGERLARIRPGQTIEVHLDATGRLQRLDYKPDALTTVSYQRDGSGFSSALTEHPVEARERTVSTTLKNSLFLDGQRAGLSNRIVMQMVDIFRWDIDFALGTSAGDRFTVIYEQLYKGEHKIRDGDILAAEYINRGRVFRAVRFMTPDGQSQYYTPEGRSMQKAFLRTPIRFARIASRFNLARKHPILHKVRAHRGIDYPAPLGTPVKATGDGKIEFVGRKRDYGNTIIIRHGGGVYSTLYGHLQKYARSIRNGSSVRQGQTIGYVGKSGLATGPHLHYEFRVRDRHKDPERVRLPKSLLIASAYREEFLKQAIILTERLDHVNGA